MRPFSTAILLASLFSATSAFVGPTQDLIRILGPQGVNLWKLQAKEAALQAQAQSQEAQNIPVYPHDGRGSQQQPMQLADLNGKKGRKGKKGKKDRYAEFPPQWFTQPLDHFDKTYKEHTWKQRYWVNKRHYVPGTRGVPVVVLDGGETSGVVCLTDSCFICFSRLIPYTFFVIWIFWLCWIDCGKLTRFGYIEPATIH
jgi:hypothetical protein